MFTATADRVAHRHLGSLAVRKKIEPIFTSTLTTLDAAHLERILAEHGIEADDLVFHRDGGGYPPNVYAWDALSEGRPVRGAVALRLRHGGRATEAVCEIYLRDGVVHRRQGAIFRTLSPVPIIMSDGGVVSTADLERLIAVGGLHVADIRIHRSVEMTPGLFVWTGRDADDGHSVRGQLRFHFRHDPGHVVVSAEITVLNMDVPQWNKEAREDRTGLNAEERLRLISSIGRRAIVDLRERPTELDVLAAHLSDVVELAEGDGLG